MPSAFDPAKDAANRKKHGVSLAEGGGVLNDPLALTIEDSTAQGEQRFISNHLRAQAEPREIRAYEKGV